MADSARTNINSTTRGNVGILDPSTTGRGPNDLPGLHNHNLNLALLAHVSDAMLLRDVANLDFRPLPTGLLAGSGVALIDTPGLDASTAIAAGTGVSNDIGAYDMQSSFYWIPGRQVAAASSPVPPHNATNVRPNADLMFLGGAGAESHAIFLNGLEVSTLLASESNIFTPAARFVPGSTYKWRVDAVMVGGIIIPGEVNTFTVGCADANCVDCGVSTEVGSCVTCSDGLSVLGGRCAQLGGCLDNAGSWTINATATGYDSCPSPGTLFGSTCTFTNIAGYFHDAFSLVAKAQTCATVGERLYIAKEDGTLVQGLSCSNNNFELSAYFSCAMCASGFVHDDVVDSRCVLNHPASPPPAPIVPLPSFILPVCAAAVDRLLLNTPIVTSCSSSRRIQVGGGGSGSTCQRKFALGVLFFQLPDVIMDTNWTVFTARLTLLVDAASGGGLQVVAHGLGLRETAGARTDDYYAGISDPAPAATLLAEALASPGLSTGDALQLDMTTYVDSLIISARESGSDVSGWYVGLRLSSDSLLNCDVYCDSGCPIQRYLFQETYNVRSSS